MRGYLHAAVAQWIEYWPPKPRVVGSIPASRTKITARLQSLAGPARKAGDIRHKHTVNGSSSVQATAATMAS